MKYLLEIHHGIGDVVKYTGLIKSVKTYDKEAYIGIVLNKDAYKALFSLDNDIDYIHVIDFSGNKKKLIKEILSIRRIQYDYMVCSYHSSQPSMEFMAVTFGANKVAGSKLERLRKFSEKYIHVPLKNEHEIKRNYNILLGLNPEFSFFEPYLICPLPPYPLSGRTIGLCIGTSLPHKTWPIERYIAVGEYFEKRGYDIVLLGGNKEAEHFDSVGYTNEKWINLLGKTDLIESASECSLCTLVIGGDTGLMCMAAAVGTTTLTLFSCSDPFINTPYSTHSYYYYVPTSCQFCFGTHCLDECRDYKCLNNITIEKVIEIAEGILANPMSVEKQRLKVK